MTNHYVGFGFKCLILDKIREGTHVADPKCGKKALIVGIVVLINSATIEPKLKKQNGTNVVLIKWKQLAPIKRT